MGRVKGRAFVMLFVSAGFLGAVEEFPAKVREGREDLFPLMVGMISVHHGAKRHSGGHVLEKGIVICYCNLLDYEQTLDQRPGLPIPRKESPVAVCKPTSEALCLEGSTTSSQPVPSAKTMKSMGGGHI